MPSQNSKIYLETLLAFAVIAGGTALRFYGLDFGLPHLYVGDEFEFVGRGFQMLVTGDPNPRWFGHPGTPTIYLFAALFAGKFSGGSASPADLFYLARISVAVFASGTLLLTYLIGRRVAGFACGLTATAILAVTPLHVQYSRIARSDLQMAFLVLASLWFILSIMKTGRWRDYLLAGFLLGLAVATKYLALILAVCVIWAHCLHQLSDGEAVWRNPMRLIGAGLATCVGFLVGTPFILLEYRIAWASLVRESRSFHLGATADGFLANIWWYLTHTIMSMVGPIGLLMIAVGIGFVIARRARGMSVIGVFCLAALVLHAILNLRWERWLIPALPCFAMLAAFGLRHSLEWMSARMPASWRTITPLLGLAILALMIARPAIDAIQRARSLANADSRTLAAEWIMENAAPGSSILAEGDTPQLPKDRFRYYRVENGNIMPNDFDQILLLPLNIVIPAGAVGQLRSADAVDRARIDYIVLSNQYDRRRAEPFHHGQEAAYADTRREIDIYEELMSRHDLVYEVWPERGKVAGNHVRVYRRRPGIVPAE